DVRDRSAAPCAATRPVGCLDEKPVVLPAAVRPSLPPAPGRPARHDSDRGGPRQPVGDGRAVGRLAPPRATSSHLEPRERRTNREEPQPLRSLVAEVSPEAAVIRVVEDTLSPPTPSSRSATRTATRTATCPPEQASTIRRRLEVHPTPRQGSWLTMAE